MSNLKEISITEASLYSLLPEMLLSSDIPPFLPEQRALFTSEFLRLSDPIYFNPAEAIGTIALKRNSE